MKTSSVKKYSLLFGLLLVLCLGCIAVVVLTFTRMYQNDMRALTDFMSSYQVYDRAVAAAYASRIATNSENPSLAEAEERQLDAALSDLKIKSSVQISSLIKNEDEAMLAMQEITNLSNKEVSTLKAYQEATGQGGNRDDLEQFFHDLTKERQDVFAHFQELGQ